MAARASSFSLGSNDAEDIRVLIDSPAFAGLTKGQRSIITELARLTESSEQVDIESLATACSLAATSITLYSNKLVEMGFMTKMKVRREGVKFSILYTLTDMAVIGSANVPRSKQGRVRLITEPSPQQKLFDDESSFPVSWNENISGTSLINGVGHHKAEIFSIYTLMSVLRIAKSGRETKGSYIAPIYIGGEMMTVEVMGQGDSQIASVMDSKALIGLTTLCERFYTTHSITESMGINLGDFVQFLDMEDTGGARKMVWNQVNAWRQTSFRIIHATNGLINLYGNELFEIEDFTIVPRLKTIVDGKTGVPITFGVWFDPLFLQRILDKNHHYLSVVDERILKEKNPFRLITYYWCRRFIKYDTNGKTVPFKHMKREVRAMYSDRQFKKSMLTAFGECKAGDRFRFYSYIITILKDIDSVRGNENFVHIKADPRDSIVQNYRRLNAGVARINDSSTG